VQSLTPVFGVFSGVPLSRRSQDQIAQREAFNVSFGGKSRIGAAELDGTLAYALTEENEPHTLETGFLSNDTYRVSYDLARDAYAPIYALVDETDPTDTSSASEPAYYRLSYLTVTHSDIEEQDASAKLNLQMDLQNGSNYLKFGAKVQRRRRTADIDRDLFDAGESVRDMTRRSITSSPMRSARSRSAISARSSNSSESMVTLQREWAAK
jgi:hypothetical protein